MSATPVIRATPRHAAVVGGLLFDFNTEFGARTPTAAELAGRFTALLTRDDVVVLLSGDAGDPTGLAFLTLRPTPYQDGPLAQLEELYVRPHLRDRGIGTALIGEALRLLRDLHAAELHINVDEVDADTRRFYERHGFSHLDPDSGSRMFCYLQEL